MKRLIICKSCDTFVIGWYDICPMCKNKNITKIYDTEEKINKLFEKRKEKYYGKKISILPKM